MNKKGVQIGVIATGVISALLLTLYLPVIIWSPPWGKYGYYLAYDYMQTEFRLTYSRFKNGELDSISYNKKTGKLEKISYLYKLDNNKINTWDAVRPEKAVQLIVTEKTIEYYTENEKTINGALSPTNTKTKIHNPFTIWHIKWIECVSN